MFKKKKPNPNIKPVEAMRTVGKIDIPFLLIVLILLAIGLAMVASASYVSSYYEKQGNSYYYITRQVIFAAIGLVIMLVTALIDYHRFKKFTYLLLAVSVIMLILVLIPGIGIKVDGARRWLSLGIRFQPSEIGKFAIILYFASYISANYKNMDKFKVGVLPLIVTLITVVGLVAVETHLSGAILILAIGAIMMFIGGVAIRYFAMAVAIGGTGLTILYFATDYMKNRVAMWINPYSDPQGGGYQIIQSLYAIGSGGLLGLGFGQSRQKHLYIPKPYNDYVFSIAAEELGFVGALLIIILFVMLIWRGFMIAFHSRDKFGAMLVIGIVSRVAVQAILNIGVVTNALPSTGISLPFFSYGGTALVMLLFEMGVVLSVSRYSYIDRR